MYVYKTLEGYIYIKICTIFNPVQWLNILPFVFVYYDYFWNKKEKQGQRNGY